MSTLTPAQLLAVATGAADVAGAVAVEFSTQRLEFEVKHGDKAGLSDLVSVADGAVERVVMDYVATACPDASFIAEESGATGTSAICWIIDPIDATMNFAYRRPDWAISIAAYQRHADGTLTPLAGVVDAPLRQERFTAAVDGPALHNGEPIAPSPATTLAEVVVELGLGNKQRRAQMPAVLAALLAEVRDVRRGGCAALALCEVAAGRVDAHYAPSLKLWDSAAGSLIASRAGAMQSTLAGDVLLTAAPGVHALLADVLTSTL